MNVKEKLTQLLSSVCLDFNELKPQITGIFPNDEDCFEYCYIRTLYNLLNLHARKNKIQISSEHKLSGYHRISTQKFSLCDEKNKNSFKVKMEYFSNSSGDDIVLKINYDNISLFVSSADGKKLKIHTLI